MTTKLDEPIRVLHVLQRMEAGGTQAFLMNLYRNIVAIEAQSSGLPMICSGGVAEDADVSPVFGRMSLQDSPKAWAEAIVKAASERDCAAGAAGARAHGFDVRANAAKIQDWYLAEARYAR